MRSAKLAALVALALGAVAAVWLTALRRTSPSPVAGRSAESVGERASNGSELDALTSRSDPLAALVVDGERAAVGTEGATDDWIDVRVVLPAGAPADETLVVRAAFLSWSPEESREPWFFRGGELQSPRGLEDGELVKLLVAPPLVRSALGEVTSFPVRADASLALVGVDGRFVSAYALVRLADGERGAVLTPELGCWLHGDFVLPGGASERGVALPGDVVVYAGLREDVGSYTVFRNSAQLEAGPWEMRGVPANTPLLIAARLRGLVTDARELEALRPGGSRRIDLSPCLGGRIAGRVVNELGSPVSGASVSGENDPRWWSVVDLLSADNEQRVDADDEGRFVLLGVAPGSRTFQAYADGYLPGVTESVDVVDGTEIDDLVIVLPSGAGIAGVVLWPDGRPAAGAEVTAISDEVGRWPPARGGSATTDDAGSFALTGLEGERFYVTALARPEGEDGARWSANAPWVPVGPSRVELVLGPPLSLRAVLRDDHGEAVDAAFVGAENARAHGETRRGSGRGDGVFELTELFPGRWVLGTAENDLHASASVEVDLPRQAGETIELVLHRKATVAGTVLSPLGEPVAGALVDSLAPSLHYEWGRDLRARSNSDGRFELDGLTPGNAVLQATAAGFASSEPTSLVIDPGESRELVLHLRAGAVLAGEVLDAEGRAVADREVWVGRDPNRSWDTPLTRTDAEGRFRLEGLEPGAWIAMAGEDPFGPFDGGVYAAAVVAERAKALIQERVELVLGEETRVVLRPPRKSAVLLVGRLTDAGNPVPGTRVIGSHEDDSYWSRGLEATTDADGVFEMQLDRPGDWLLAPQLEEGDAHASFSIRVPRVERHAVELALPGGRIGGTVRGPAGPLAGLRVHAVGEEGATSFELRADVSGVRTDDAGRYELRRLRPGTYTVRVTSALQGFSRPSVSTGFAAAVRGGIPVADAGLSRVDFELVPGGIVEGFARDTEGRPVAGAAVHVRLEDGTRTEVFASSLSDARGRFRITDVPAGSVTLSARTTALAAAESARVSVKTSETSAVELVLSAGAVLDVRVVDESGAALAFDLSTRDAHGFEVPGLWIERDLKDSLFSVTRRRVGPLPLGTYSIAARTRDGRSVTESVALSAPGLREVVLRLPD